MVHVLKHITQILMVCPVTNNIITYGSRPGIYYSNTDGLSCNLFNNIRKKCRGYRCESDMSLQMEMRLKLRLMHRKGNINVSNNLHQLSTFVHPRSSDLNQT